MQTEIKFKLNGQEVSFVGSPLARLIDVIRENFNLLGSKEGCSEGECGACSVLRNGKLVTSCIIPVGAIAGDEIITIEGLRDTAQGKCLVDSFAEGGAVQCGFCIPGMVLAAQALLLSNPKPTEQDVRIAISGNICRCTGYDLIVESILLAAKKGAGLW
ncbi:MAG: (2Fe-2S)-binding protein [Spirochaetales bacterium]|nr:(2Fe-2S)-binding protein [Spirochaetales bacterium]